MTSSKTAALSRYPFLSLCALPGFALAAALAGCGGDDEALASACLQSTSSGGVVVGSGLPGDPAIPEPASGYKLGAKPVTSKNYMVVTANPLASQAGCDVLRQGGSAVDAAVAVQAVLGLVEPQSSGLGGGAFMVHYNAKTKVVQAYDGREQAPAAATPDYLRYISAANTAYPLPTPAGTASDDESVRRRAYKGYCSHNRETLAAAAEFRTARPGLLAELATITGLDERSRRKAVAYLEGFFDDVASDERTTKKILANCLR